MTRAAARTRRGRARGTATVGLLCAALLSGAAAAAPETDDPLAAARRSLRAAALAMDGCPGARAATGAAAALSSARPSDAAAAFLEGEARALARSLCGASAGDPGPALARAARLGEPAAAALWALLEPESAAARGAVEAARARAPADPALALAASFEPGLEPAAALLLLDGAAGCVPGSGLRRGELLPPADPRAAAAFRQELYGDCPARWTSWVGDALAARLRARLGLARAAVALGDGLEARRQLALARFDSVDAAIPLPAGGPALAALEKAARRLLLPPLRASGPELAIHSLERAALLGDLRGVRARLAPGARDALSSCEAYRGTPQEGLCALTRLLPEAPARVACAGAPVRCTVTGAAGDERTLRATGHGATVRLSPE